MNSEQLLVLIGGIAAIAGVNWYFFLAGPRQAAVARPNALGSQVATITVLGGYSPSVVKVKKGSLVRLVFDRRETSSCSEEIVLPDFGIRRFLPANQQTIIEFTPEKPGTYDFMCGMSMLRGKLIVE